MNAFCLCQIRHNQTEMVVAGTIKNGYGRGETERRKEREHESYRTNVPFVLGNVGAFELATSVIVRRSTVKMIPAAKVHLVKCVRGKIIAQTDQLYQSTWLGKYLVSRRILNNAAGRRCARGDRKNTKNAKTWVFCGAMGEVIV